MADSSARRIVFESNRQTKSDIDKNVRIAPNSHQVRWTGLERTLVILGSIIILGMMTFLVSSSISATSAQHELADVQQSITREQNRVINLRQQIGELTSSNRLNKIARAKGLTLIEKNIRTIR